MRSYFVFGKRKTKLFRITLLSFVLQLFVRFIALKVAHYLVMGEIDLMPKTLIKTFPAVKAFYAKSVFTEEKKYDFLSEMKTKNLREAMRSTKTSPKTLADYLGVSIRTVEGWRQGRSPSRAAQKLLRIYFGDYPLTTRNP